MPLPTSIQLDDLNGTNGFRLTGLDGIDGAERGDRGGEALGSGDFNGDGITDLIIGAAGGDPGGRTNAGEVYVVFGQQGGFAADLDLSALSPDQGFRINGPAADTRSGTAVAGIGDFDGDGFDDIFVGDANPSSIDFGGPIPVQSHIVFGGSDLGSTVELSNLFDNSSFIIGDDFDGFDIQASAAGDINGDGNADLIIGTSTADPNGNSSGKTFVVFGTDRGADTLINIENLQGSSGFEVNGIDVRDFSGKSVSGAGDVNGDGIDDLIIGAFFGDANGQDSGESYVLFGTREPFNADIELSDIDGSNGFLIAGTSAGDQSGFSVSGAGDVNGDGIADLIIGAARGGDSAQGESYVVFGSRNGFAPRVDLANLDGSDGFTITGVDAGDLSGSAVAAAGDVNGDGLADVVIGATEALGPGFTADAGETYIVFGRNDGVATVDLANLGDAGVVIQGPSGGNGGSLAKSGTALTSGDFNGDGIGDVAIGAPGASSSAGDTFIIFGDTAVDNGDLVAPTGVGDTIVGTDNGETLFGLGGDDTIDALDGNDILDGGLGADLLRGGDGSDTYIVDNIGDVVVELPGEGATDRINLFVENPDFVAPLNVEQVVLQAGVITATAAQNVTPASIGTKLVGLGDDNVFFSGTGTDFFDGNGGRDTLSYANAQAGVEASFLKATAFNTGGAGTDKIDDMEILIGSAFDDVLVGGQGVMNEIDGGAGNDVIVGFAGADTLTGGEGADTFLYNNLVFRDSNVGAEDTILDFEVGTDKIDLTRLLGDNSSIQTFAGGLNVDVDGNGSVDFAINFANNVEVTQGDILI